MVFLVAVLAASIGLLVGTVAGYAGGWVDATLFKIPAGSGSLNFVPWVQALWVAHCVIKISFAVIEPCSSLRRCQRGQSQPGQRLRCCHGALWRHDLGNHAVVAFYGHRFAQRRHPVQNFTGSIADVLQRDTVFKISIAHTLTAGLDAAESLAEQTLRKLEGHKPSAALLFSTTGRNHAGLLQRLTRLLPDCPIVGGSSNGEVSREQGYRVGSSVLIVFASDTVTIRAGVLRDLSFDNQTLNQQAAAQQFAASGLIGSVAVAKFAPPVLGLLFPDGIGLDGESVVKLFSEFF